MLPAAPPKLSINCRYSPRPSSTVSLIQFERRIRLMAGKNKAVFGIYRTVNQAEQSVDRLLAVGFSNDDISVLLPDNQGTKDFAHEKNTKAPEGTTTGATAGGVVGGTLGLLAGIGALAIPGVGPFIAAGPVLAARARGA